MLRRQPASGTAWWTSAPTGGCLFDLDGVPTQTADVALVKTLRAQGTPVAVVSASENNQAALET